MPMSLCGVVVMTMVVACASLLAPPRALASDPSTNPDDWTFAGFTDPGQWSAFFEGPSGEVREAELERYADLLGMDADQRMLAQEMLAEHRREIRRIETLRAEAQSDMRAEMMLTQDWQSMQSEMAKLREQSAAELADAQADFLADLRVLLTPEQEERWPLVERERRRRGELSRFGVFGGESVDLIAMAEGLDLSPSQRESIAPVLERYADELDRMLTDRSRRMASVAETAREATEAQMELGMLYQNADEPPSPDEIMKLQEDIQSKQSDAVRAALDLLPICARVRDLNMRFADELEAALPAAQARELREQVDDAIRSADGGGMFSMMNWSRARMMFNMLEDLESTLDMYKQSMQQFDDGSGRMTRMLEMMGNAEPLSEDQRRRIERIRDDWEAETERHDRKHNPRLAEMQRSQLNFRLPGGTLTLMSADAQGGGFMGGMAAMGGGGDNEEAQREKFDIDQRAIDRVREVLTMGQRALIAQF